MKSKIENDTMGQVQTQIFVYIVAIVILGMILVFGYNAIQGFGEKSQEIDHVKFKQDVQGTFKQLRSSFGQVKNKVFTVPDKYKEVCFVNLEGKDDAIANGVSNDVVDYFHNPIIAAGVEERNNVFLVDGLDVQGYNVGKLDTDADEDPLALVYPDTYNAKLPKLGFESNNIPESSDGYILCFKPRRTKVRVLLKGMGDHVFVSQP